MCFFHRGHIKTVKFHPYRSTRAWPIVLTVHYESGDDTYDFQAFLGRKAGRGCDNHIVYEVTYDDGNVVCFWFSDWKCYVALKCDNIPW